MSAIESLPGIDNGLLRFLTCGSVDDGKSTLIGRLLFDTKTILADTLHAITRTSERRGLEAVDLSLLTDGLLAEREQGITIDVAWRYFATPARKFIIADAPGHEQYTRNMVTAAAGSDAAVVLVDITKIDWRADAGQPVQLLAQTRRHALLAQLLRVPNIVFAVNKLDAVDDPAGAFAATRHALLAFALDAGIEPAGVVPVSALRGDNVASPLATDWYDGPSLLQLLERLPEGAAAHDGAALLPVQFIGRHGDGTGDQARVLWGRVAQGAIKLGDRLQVHPSGEAATVRELRRAGGHVESACAGESAGVVFDRQLDVSRGDWLGAPGSLRPATHFSATLAWLDTEPAVVGRRYLVRHGHRWVHARITAIEHRLDIHTLAPTEAHELAVNEIGDVSIELQQPLPLIPYRHNQTAGALIVVDPRTHRTSAALLVKDALRQQAPNDSARTPAA